MPSMRPFITRPAAITRPLMMTVFTDAGKVAGFIIQRGCVGFEAFTADETTTLRELAALPCPIGDAPGRFIA